MKTTIILILILMTCGLAFAEPSLSEALAWKYGYCFGTKQADEKDLSPNPKMIISYWNCAQPQPNESEIVQIKSDYEVFANNQKAEKLSKKSAVLAKLKITEQEWNDLNG